MLVAPLDDTNNQIDHSVLSSAGYEVNLTADFDRIDPLIHSFQPDLVILGEKSAGSATFSSFRFLIQRYPFIPFVLVPETHTTERMADAIQAGFCGYIQHPGQSDELLKSVQSALERRQQWINHSHQISRRDTKSLQRRVDGLESVERVGRQVTSILDLDSVLSAIVCAAVELSGAEEGSLLLVDEDSGELFIRASQNFQDDFIKKFRLPIRDSLAGQVLLTGKPLLIDTQKPKKIKTEYLVHTLIYMPIKLQERVIGILEVDNRLSGKPFSDYHTSLLSALSDYAAVAIENASLYARSEEERRKLDAILMGIEDGVIVTGPDGRIILTNLKARQVFNLQEAGLVGKNLFDLNLHQELYDVLKNEKPGSPTRLELSFESGMVFNTQITPIEGIGLVIIMQDITHLKQLDQVKTDFVNTVSHDIRSPLTAILGYVELIERVGPVTQQQKEFIQRVQLSVHSITALINDLLELGRIEAGFDTRKEKIPFSPIAYYAIDSLRNRAAEKSVRLKIEVPEEFPEVLVNPLRLRQMTSILLANAIKVSSPGGEVRVHARAEAGQIILQVSDDGPGIHLADQPYIFDKFFKPSNIPTDAADTGLGLAIVKSIVDNHQGRILGGLNPGTWINIYSSSSDCNPVVVR